VGPRGSGEATRDGAADGDAHALARIPQAARRGGEVGGTRGVRLLHGGGGGVARAGASLTTHCASLTTHSLCLPHHPLTVPPSPPTHCASLTTHDSSTEAAEALRAQVPPSAGAGCCRVCVKKRLSPRWTLLRALHPSSRVSVWLTAMEKVANRTIRVWHRATENGPMNDGQRPNFRVVRVALGTGCPHCPHCPHRPHWCASAVPPRRHGGAAAVHHVRAGLPGRDQG
jgi:hypothetical protein